VDCTQVRAQLDAYDDGELDAVAARRLEEHLIGCPDCLQAEEHLSALRRAVRKHAAYHLAPEPLRERVASILDTLGRPHSRPAVTLRWWQLGGFLGATATASALCTLLVLGAASPGGEEKLADELVSSHVRSLMQDHLLDVASTDQHTVKPWFAGKLDYSPPVRDLSAAGFPLLGGRLDYVDGHPVAVLVYQRRQHRINVYVWPERGGASPRRHAMTHNGYNSVGWVANGMVFWAVSDLNAAELAQLEDLYRQQNG